MYEIYMHESPEGKRYVGCTSKGLDIRSGKYGQNYNSNPDFRLDIERFGWDKFKHTVLDWADSKELALKLEDRYMYFYDTVHNGYNRRYNFPKTAEL